MNIHEGRLMAQVTNGFSLSPQQFELNAECLALKNILTNEHILVFNC